MDSDLTPLVALAYDAALTPALWQDFLALLARELGGASLGLSLRHARDGNPGWMLFHGSDPASARAYAEHFFRLDPFRVRSDALEPGGCEVMAGGSIEAGLVERLEVYNDWMRPQGFAPAPSIGVTLDRNAFGEPVGIAVFCPRGARPYGDREVRMLRTLIPHLQRATRTALRLADTESQLSAAADALDLLPVAALLLDADGHVVRANQKAAAIAERGHPFLAGRRGLTLESDVITALRLAADGMRADRSSARGPAHDVVMVRRADEQPPLWLRPVPCSSPEVAGVDGSPEWLWVLVDDSDDVARPSSETLSSVLGLTNAEARVCALLVAGRRLEQIATELGIKHETARTHLKAAFRKTGARSQTDLVRLVLQRPLLTAQRS